MVVIMASYGCGSKSADIHECEDLMRAGAEAKVGHGWYEGR